MNCSKCDLYFSSPGCLSIHEKSCRLSKSLINHLKNDYINGLSIRKLNLKYGCSKSLISNLILDIVRTKSESSKLAHSLYADKFKHSEESKQKLREQRIKWMKENGLIEKEDPSKHIIEYEIIKEDDLSDLKDLL